jgi:hypothetical protein
MGYAQPKPMNQERVNVPINDRLIKINIEREIEKAQFNTLSKLIDLGDFKRLKPRAPKDLMKRIFKPVSVDRQPFLLKKWQSPFQDFKQQKT